MLMLELMRLLILLRFWLRQDQLEMLLLQKFRK
jgi:hypothetical protein